MYFRRILFATDGSPAALRAAHVVAEMACHNQETSVTVAAPISCPQLEKGSVPNFSPIGKAFREERENAERAVLKTAAVFASWGLPYSCLLVEGDCACTAIAQAAKADLCDVIAMSSREKTLAPAKAGTTNGVNLTEEVMQRASVPVLIISPQHPAIR